MVTKARSPNYPAFGLAKAIELIRKVHAGIHHHKAPPLVVVKAIGYTTMNGRALASISALKKYELLEEVGKEFKVSKDAMTILFEPETSPVRKSALQRAAYAPDLFTKLRKEFPGKLPSDELLRGFLLTTVDQAIRAYRDTMALVEDGASGYTGGNDASAGKGLEDADEVPDESEIEIGDLVQWEASGVLRMAKPAVVRALSEDKAWAFVEGSDTGIPMEELLLEQKAAGAPAKTPPKLALPEQVFETPVTAGEKEW
jgi:hypothetical protein